MTTKRDKESEPKTKRPKLKKETLKDLAPTEKAEGVRGGAARHEACSARDTGCAQR